MKVYLFDVITSGTRSTTRVLYCLSSLPFSFSTHLKQMQKREGLVQVEALLHKASEQKKKSLHRLCACDQMCACVYLCVNVSMIVSMWMLPLQYAKRCISNRPPDAFCCALAEGGGTAPKGLEGGAPVCVRVVCVCV